MKQLKIPGEHANHIIYIPHRRKITGGLYVCAGYTHPIQHKNKKTKKNINNKKRATENKLTRLQKITNNLKRQAIGTTH